MSATTEQLLPTLLALPLEDRQVILHRLIDSVESRPDVDEDLEFVAELMRRVDEIKNGQDLGIPADDVFNEMKERFG
jgi:putative addiction module component (TIGR02574 family)